MERLEQDLNALKSPTTDQKEKEELQQKLDALEKQSDILVKERDSLKIDTESLSNTLKKLKQKLEVRYLEITFYQIYIFSNTTTQTGTRATTRKEILTVR